MRFQRIFRHPLLALMLLGGIASAQATTVYRWVDERGRVHYGDQRGHGASSIEVTPGSGVVKPAAEPDNDRTARSQECERRKSQLEAYRGATTVMETDALGQRHEFNADEKTRLLQITEQQVQLACGATDPGS